jgi:hypothetical protein
MADFLQAVKWMREGKQVRKGSMIKDVYLFIKGDRIYHRGATDFNENCKEMIPYASFIENENWEIYEEETLIIKKGYYKTKCGRYLYIHDITYYNSPDMKIASIVTGKATIFCGDSRTNVFRRVFTEEEFRNKVEEKVA